MIESDSPLNVAKKLPAWGRLPPGRSPGCHSAVRFGINCRRSEERRDR